MSNADNCPNAQNHTQVPSGYIAWHDWVHNMAKTHRQTRCAGCGLWAIWVPKEGKDLKALAENTQRV